MGRVYYQSKAEVPLGPEEQLGYNPKAGYYARDKSLASRVIGRVKPKPKPLPPVPKPPAPKPVPPKPAPSPRDRFVQWLRWGVAHEPEIHYEMRRPIPVYREPGHLPLWTDCSGFLILAAKWANVPDPSGENFSGDGFTGSMLDHLPEIKPHEALPGDLIIYGPGSGQHATGIVELIAPGDFVVCSHGQERGPVLLRHSVEARFHSPPARFLRFLA